MIQRPPRSTLFPYTTSSDLDRDYMNFNRRKEGPVLGPDLTPRPIEKTPEETAKHQAEYAAMIKGQIEELLTNYGKIDLRSEEHTSELQSQSNLVCRLLLEKK